MAAFIIFLGAVCVAIGLAAALLLSTAPLLFWFVAVLIATGYLACVALSFRIIRKGTRIAVFFLDAGFRYCFVNDDDWKELKERYKKRKAEWKRNVLPYVVPGILGNIAYAQFPFYFFQNVTTASVRVPIEKVPVWTMEVTLQRPATRKRTFEEVRDKEKSAWKKSRELSSEEHKGKWELTHEPLTRSKREEILEETEERRVRKEIIVRTETIRVPRVHILVNGEVYFAIGIRIGKLIQTFPDIPLMPSNTEELREFLSRKVEPLIHEAIRQAVAGGFEMKRGKEIETVPGMTWDEDMDVVKQREELETRVRAVMGSQPQSVLIRAGMIQPWDGKPGAPDHGPSASFDFTVEDITLANEDLQRAVDGLLVARKDAQGLIVKETALKRVLEERMEEWKKHGVEGADILGHDAIRGKERGTLNLASIGPNIGKMLSGLFQQKEKKTRTK